MSSAANQEEWLLIAALVAIVVAMGLAIIAWFRLHEARLARQATLELPFDSALRSLLVFVPALCIAPVLVGLFAHFNDPWGREHAMAAVLIGTVGGLLGLPVAAWATVRFRARGWLRLLQGEVQCATKGASPVSISTDRAFELSERWAVLSGAPYQVVEVSSGEARVGFIYPLGGKDAPKGEPGHGDWPELGSGARLLHQRLRARREALGWG